MDYTVGSLSDLITGGNTPNKRKVTKKVVKAEKSEPEIEENDTLSKPLLQKKAKKALKKKAKLIKDVEAFESPAQKSPRKRKHSKSQDEETVEVSTVEENNTSSKPLLEKKAKKARKKEKSKKNVEVSDDSVQKPKKRKHSETENEETVKENGDNVDEKLVEIDPEIVARTVFVGNVPITTTKVKLIKFFSKYGEVETVRIRGVPVADPRVPKKVALIKKQFHPDRKSFIAFVRFKDRESASKATEANGILFHDHHLRVQGPDDKPEENKAIFVGNLSFYAEEDDLWKAFEPCGAIFSVRIVRDPKTGIGKGFGYVNFKSADSVTLALEMENVKIKDRELRIKTCNLKAAKKLKPEKKPKTKKTSFKPKKPKPEEGETKPEIKMKPFQGIKFAPKKAQKKKLDKGLQQKKIKIKKIAPR